MTKSASSPSSSKRTGKNTRTQQPESPYCMLTRIDDDTYVRLSKYSYPISEQPIFLDYRHAPEDRLNTAQYYAGLRCLFGKPGDLYDDWKGSFSFSFQADVFRNKQSYPYLLKITHFRSGVEFGFRKIIKNPEGIDPFQMMVYHQPFKDELSGKEMEFIELYTYGFLLGYLEVIHGRSSLEVPDFVLLSESNFIISGYADGKFFEKYMQDYDEFEAEINKFHDLIHHPVKNWPDDNNPPTILTIELECAAPTTEAQPHD
ncbi:MAG: hypothetical protein L0H54_07520 [Alcaligenaceae bacterium]|nr:hypothetical protein [Alcaligenaceae bacterium]